MSELLLNASRVALLAVPAVLGALLTRSGVIRRPADAMGGLNAFALYVGFPSLVVVGLVDGDFRVPSTPGFWALVPVHQALLVATLFVAARLTGTRDERGTLGLVALFANVAYLGLPLVVAIFGESVRGIASLLVSIHVALGVSLGPVLLAKYAGGGDGAVPWGRVLRQPLLWAPVVGGLLRLAPDSAQGLSLTILQPLAAAAAPVALFLLGIQLFVNRGVRGLGEVGVWLHVAGRLAIGPVLAVAVAWPLVGMGQLEPMHAAVAVTLAGMPAAVTTLILARDAETGVERITSVLVVSTLLCLVTLPLLATIAARAFGVAPG